MNILLAVDSSACTQRMLSHLAEHVELLPRDSDVTAFTVIDAASLDKARFAKATSMDGFLGEQAEAVLAPVRTFLEQRGCRVRTDHVPGLPAQAIVAKAETLRADLIVMGTQARSAFGAFVLGSVAGAVLSHCKVPVLLIR